MIQPNWRTILLMMLIIVLFNIGYSFLLRDAGKSAEISYSRFLSELAGNNLKTVSFKGTAANGEFLKKIKVSETVQGKEVIREVEAFTTTMPATADPALITELTVHKVEIRAVSPEASLLVTFLVSLLPWLLIIGVWWYISRNARSQGPAGMLAALPNPEPECTAPGRRS